MTNLAHRLANVIGKSERRVIGLMSGMSMDGVDLADVHLAGPADQRTTRLLGTHYCEYDPALRARLLDVHHAAPAELARLDFEVAEVFADVVRDYLAGRGLEPATIDAIGSHGQTAYHRATTGDARNATLQLGPPSVIAERTGLLTVGNFRVRDVAAGGLGAPLVGIADHLLFGCSDETVVLHNLGNVSNLSVVTPDPAHMIAFDTGPANVGIDHFVRQHGLSESNVDWNGEVSARGRVDEGLLAELRALPYFARPIPKAAGYEEFGPAVLDRIARAHAGVKPEDLVRTAVEFTAVTIRDAYETFVVPRHPDARSIKFSGGGVYNRTLMTRIRELLPRMRIEVLPDDLADAKEAIAFAILADRTLSGVPGSLPNLTGARAPVVLGEIGL